MTEDPGGLTNGQQIGIGATIASLGGMVDWNSVGDWLGTNFKSIVRDIGNGFREAGRFLKRIFGGKKRKSSAIEFDTYTNLTSDPLAGTSFGTPLQFFSGGTLEGKSYSDLRFESFINNLEIDYLLTEDPKERRRIRRQIFKNEVGRAGMRSDDRVREWVAPTDPLGIVLHFGTLGIGSQWGLGVRAVGQLVRGSGNLIRGSRYFGSLKRTVSPLSHKALMDGGAYSILGE
jgi:hypothetical protein